MAPARNGSQSPNSMQHLKRILRASVIQVLEKIGSIDHQFIFYVDFYKIFLKNLVAFCQSQPNVLKTEFDIFRLFPR